MARDANIYGSDDTAYAERVSGGALGDTGLGAADIWGDFQDSRAISKANVGAESTGPDNPKTPVVKGTGHSAHGTLAGGGDHEPLTQPYPQLQRFPRHTPGPNRSHDEGGGVKTPPPRNHTATRKGGSPKP